MLRYFLDSSALVKRYHAETGSSKLDHLFAVAENRFFVSRLALVEVQSSFARLSREGMIDGRAFTDLVARLEQDIAEGLLVVIAVNSSRLDEAAHVLRTHGLKRNLRTLDAIHLATALALFQRRRLAGFVASDRRLLEVAEQACGLPVLDLA